MRDVDGDGRNDVISLTQTELIWYRNPNWSPTLIDTQRLHDIEVEDFDGDGDIDIVARHQSAFGGSGTRFFFYRQGPKGKWGKLTVSCPNGEGLKAADINGDGRLDVVLNGVWYENSGDLGGKGWIKRPYTSTWSWEHAFVNVGDVNGDGRLDIIMTPAEKAGGEYRISWFEAPDKYYNEWPEHVIEDKIETIHHFAGAADMDNDGDVDIVTAEMHQGVDPDEIKMYSNGQGGKTWTKKIIAISGSHNMQIADIDGDGDMDLFGTNWSGKHQLVETWINQTLSWERHVID